MPLSLPLRVLLVTVCTLVWFAPTDVRAQSDDPCLDALASSPEDLERYDALAVAYLDARTAGDFEAALSNLDEIEEICSENLRTTVFRADAQRELGRCEAAAATYQRVIDDARDWPHANNANDARTRAEDGLRALRQQCLAQVQVNCADTGATVEIAPRPPMLCPAEIEVPAGEYDVTVALDGHEAIVRRYTFRTGGNFVEIEALRAVDRAGTVNFACDAPDTEIVLGAERFGCPATRVLASGEYTFAAMRPGQDPFTGTLSVSEGATVEVVVPAHDDGARLELSCDPVAATVTVAGPGLAAPARSPCPLVLALPAGSYTVTTEADGHDTDVREVELATDDVLRMAVKLDSDDEVLVAFRLIGGAGLIGKDDELIDDSVAEDERDTAIAQFAGRVSALVGYNLGGGAHFAVGADVRLGVGGETGAVYGGLAEFVYDDRSYVAMLGGLVGYGRLGVDICDVSLDRCPGGVASRPEEDGMVYGGYLGGGLYLGSVGVLLSLGVVTGDLLAIDFGAGIGYRL